MLYHSDMFMHSKYHVYVRFVDRVYLKFRGKSSDKANVIDTEKKQKHLEILQDEIFHNFKVISLKTLQ